MDTALRPGRPASGGPLKRTVIVGGERTSMRLEPELWDALDEVCQSEGISLDELIRRARQSHERGTRTSAVRAYLMTRLRGHEQVAHGDPGGPAKHPARPGEAVTARD